MKYDVKMLRPDGTKLTNILMTVDELEWWYDHYVNYHRMEDKGGFLKVMTILEVKGRITLKSKDYEIYKVSQIS